MIEGGTVVFDKGKITAVGVGVKIPDGAEQVDVRGKSVYPGMIAAFSNIGLTEIGSVRGTLDMSETGDINPNVRAEVAFQPESELIPVARSGGIAIAVSTPTGGLIAGTSAAMMMDGWTWEEMCLKAPVALHIDWPAMVWRPSPFSRQSKEAWEKYKDEQLKRLNEAVADARAYRTAKVAEQLKGVAYHDVDMRWEAMMPVLDGKVPVLVAANELSEIQSALAWAEREHLKLILLGGRDAWMIADELKSKTVPVVVTEVQAAPSRRWEPYDEAFTLPNRLFQAGVRFCIAGEYEGTQARDLPHQAATAAAYGLPKTEALRAVTLSAAEILGLAERVGSIEVGKDATLFVADGDPLELSTHIEQLYIGGKTIDMRDKHKQLYEKYRAKYRQLSEEK